MVGLDRRVNLVFRQIFNYDRPYVSICVRYEDVVPHNGLVMALSNLPIGATRFCRLITRRVQVKDRPATRPIRHVDRRVIPVDLLRVSGVGEGTVLAYDNEDRFGIFLHHAN